MPADTSNTERIRHLKATVQATGNDVPSDESTRLSRKFGKQVYFRQQGNGAVVEESCCEPTPTPTTTTTTAATTTTTAPPP
jgi:hypothetical protein